MENNCRRAVVLLSGGLDSTTVLAMARAERYACYCLSFQYGQRQKVELERAQRIAKHFQAQQHLIFTAALSLPGLTATWQAAQSNTVPFAAK